MEIKKSNVENMLGTKFIQNGKELELTPLKANKLTGLYFSASWNPLDDGMISLLTELYKIANIEAKEFEIISIYMEQSLADFLEQHALYNWPAIPYGDNRI